MLIFIIGVGRSGTSLLQSMLNAHSKVHFLKENQILRNILSGNIRENLSGENLYEDLVRKTNLGRLKIKKKDLDLSNALNAYDSIISLQKNSDRNLVFIGDKDPRNIDYIEKIQSKYPKSKIITLIRDPRSVVASRLKAKWSKKYLFI